MFSYDISDKLKKKLKKIGQKDKILAQNFKRKLLEIIARDMDSIDFYKNLRSPLNEFKRVHLTDNYILLFSVEGDHIVFVDIMHWDKIFG